MEDIVAKLLLSEMAIICILVLYQESRIRKVVAAVFAVMVVGHSRIFALLPVESFPSVDGISGQDLRSLAYYGLASFLAVSITIIVSNLNIVPRLAKDIQMLALMSAGFNFIGWLMYMKEVGPIFYESFMVAFYLYAIILLIRKEPKYGGDFANDRWISAFRLNAYSRHPLGDSN